MASLKFGSFKIDHNDELGFGSYGKVCRAKYGQLPCAAKLLHDTMFKSNDPGISKFVEQFEQECRFLSMIKHPNIVQFLGTSRDPRSRRLVLLMELMDESLKKFLERSTASIPYHMQVNICHDVALALSYLHSNAIIHRDLSSNNVLLIGEGGRAKVTDFGMSKLMKMNPRMTPLTLCPGATVYMPPEALTTPPHYSSKLDCFSHGVLTIQIITRKFPNPGDAHQSVRDPKYPTGRILIQLPETQRRKEDINLIEPDLPLLPIALHCLKDIDTERPSADDVCERLAALRKERRYTHSVEQTKDQASRLQREITQRDQLIQKHQSDLRLKDQLLHEERAKHTTELQQKVELLSKERANFRTELQKQKEERAQHETELERKFRNEKANYKLELNQFQRELEMKDKFLRNKTADYENECREHALIQLKHAEIQRERKKNQEEFSKKEQTFQQEKAYYQIQITQKDQIIDQLRKQADSAIDKVNEWLPERLVEIEWKQGDQTPEHLAFGNTAVVGHGNTAYFFCDRGMLYSFTVPENKWTKLRSCQHRSCSLAIINGKLTTIGGYDWYHGTITNVLLSFLPGDWKEVLPSMPTGRAQPAVATTPFHMVVAGGWKGSTFSDAVEILNVVTIKWLTAKCLPQPLTQPQMTLRSGYIYLSDNTLNVFLCSMRDLLKSCRAMSTTSNTSGSMWTKLANIPVRASSLVALKEYLLAIGGEADGQPTTAIHCYNKVTNSWSVIGQLPTPRFQLVSAVLQSNEIVAVGGREELRCSSDSYVISLHPEDY